MGGGRWTTTSCASWRRPSCTTTRRSSARARARWRRPWPTTPSRRGSSGCRRRCSRTWARRSAGSSPRRSWYQLLAKMNKVASDNYQNMADFAQGVAVFVESLKAKHTELLPAVERIDEMESEVAQMEAIVQQIDTFSKSLESRVNRV